MRLGSGICLVPQRNPVYTAKEFATLDWLTGGRIDFCIGVGWCKEEVIACGYRWEDRGERCDEILELMQAIWTQPAASFDGKHVSLAECRMDPKPVQKPHIPIFVGGHSAAAMKRAARFGAGWYGFALGPDAARAALEHLDAALGEANRKRGADFQIVITPPYAVTEDMVREYAALGVDRLIVQLGSQHQDKIDGRLVELEKFVGAAN
jgi:probable F420-dependent oxidoreductase